MARRRSQIFKNVFGGMAPLMAFCIVLAALFFAVIANLSINYYEKSRVQAAIDYAALLIVENRSGSESDVERILRDRGIDYENTTINLAWGWYSADPSLSVSDRFELRPEEQARNAVQIDAKIPVKADILPGYFKTENYFDVRAIAMIRNEAHVNVGSRLLRLEGGLSASILDALLGYDGRLSIMDYNQMADVNVEVLTLLRGLDQNLSLDAITYDDVLASDIGIGDIVNTLSVTTNRDGSGLSLPNVLPKGVQSFQLEQIIDLGELGGLEVKDLIERPDVTVKAIDLLMASASLSNGKNQIGIDADAGLGQFNLAALKLEIGELEKTLRWEFGSTLREADRATEQLKLNLSLLSGLVPDGLVNVQLEMANAEVEKVEVICDKKRQVEKVSVILKSSLAELSLDPVILPEIDLRLSEDDLFTVTFSAEDIKAKVVKSGRSRLGLEVNRFGRLLMRPLMRTLDNVLERTGLHPAEADVSVTWATCSRPYLVK